MTTETTTTGLKLLSVMFTLVRVKRGCVANFKNQTNASIIVDVDLRKLLTRRIGDVG